MGLVSGQSGIFPHRSPQFSWRTLTTQNPLVNRFVSPSHCRSAIRTRSAPVGAAGAAEGAAAGGGIGKGTGAVDGEGFIGMKTRGGSGASALGAGAGLLCGLGAAGGARSGGGLTAGAGAGTGAGTGAGAATGSGVGAGAATGSGAGAGTGGAAGTGSNACLVTGGVGAAGAGAWLTMSGVAGVDLIVQTAPPMAATPARPTTMTAMRCTAEDFRGAGSTESAGTAAGS